jgi:hypothetical protein
MLIREGELEQQAKYLVPNPIHANHLPDETGLFRSSMVYRQPRIDAALSAQRDRTLEPMIPPGSIVHIDTQKRAISLRDWKHESQQPVHFPQVDVQDRN